MKLTRHSLAPLRASLVILALLALPAVVVGACGSNHGGATTNGAAGHPGAGGATGSAGTSMGTGMGGDLIGFDAAGGSDAPVCNPKCSPDFHEVLDCNGGLLEKCTGTQGCDLSIQGCSDACTAAAHNQQSVGCDYYATNMEMDYSDQCFAAFVANTWSTPAHLTVEFYPGTPLPVATFARIPSGTGATLKYNPYDAAAGLQPGEVAILFLSGKPGSTVPCPIATTAIPQGSLLQGTGTGHSFHITSDLPVVAYQINPFGGGGAAITGASLLLPTSVWDTNYIAVTAAQYSAVTGDSPSMNIISAVDNNKVTILPKVAIGGGGALPAGPANVPYTFTLNKGEQAQLSQQADLSGSIIQSTAPVGLMAGNACMQAPLGTGFCDHGEQMLPPVKTLGNAYVGVMFRARVMGDKAIWHLVGTQDGTTLTYTPAAPAGAPSALSAGQAVDFTTDVPFVVTSQDAKHPFMLFTYMTGSQWSGLSATTGYGDPDFVISVPPAQYLANYVFFTDPTYPETDLVVVRGKNAKMGFDDVTLDCAGPLTGWQSVGAYEWTRVDLIRHDFVSVGGCSNGRHTMTSNTPFGLWVWGWGTPETTLFTKNVSYGYPGGMNVAPINGLVIPPQPK